VEQLHLEMRDRLEALAAALTSEQIALAGCGNLAELGNA
jgi:hypothetical protein